MAEITMQVPDELAQRLRPMSAWLPTVLELGLVGFQTPAVQTASEVIAYLATGPSPADVMAYHVSDRAQKRLRRLLALQAGGQLSTDEQAELTELERIEHILILLKGCILESVAKTDVC